MGYLGGGWEGEVFKIVELGTGIHRAAKFFHPKRNIKGKTSKTYAKKLHKLRECPVLIHYHNIETFENEDTSVKVFISEFIEGDLLSIFIKRIKTKTLSVHQGLHLLYALVSGLESIHQLGEYHGDIHADNVIIQRFGLQVDIKIFDFLNSGRSSKVLRQEDLICTIKLFYDLIGGQKRYKHHPDIVKEICCGLKHGLILKKFPTTSHLRYFLENTQWVR